MHTHKKKERANKNKSRLSKQILFDSVPLLSMGCGFHIRIWTVEVGSGDAALQGAFSALTADIF